MPLPDKLFDVSVSDAFEPPVLPELGTLDDRKSEVDREVLWMLSGGKGYFRCDGCLVVVSEAISFSMTAGERGGLMNRQRLKISRAVRVRRALDTARSHSPSFSFSRFCWARREDSAGGRL